MDSQAAACTTALMSDTTGQQIVVRPRASTQHPVCSATHTDMTKARPTQPPIPVRPDNQTLETVTELRREVETQQQQQNRKFT